MRRNVNLEAIVLYSMVCGVESRIPSIFSVMQFFCEFDLLSIVKRIIPQRLYRLFMTLAFY